MMIGIANIVAGGPIYNTNKIKYLEEKGWKVIIFPVDSGKVFIKPLEKYSGEKYDFIHYSPYILGRRRTKFFLNEMKKKIPQSENIVIETGTDYTALWGELLAKEIGAKHIVMFLDEKNDNVDSFSAPFYKFKFSRNELYGISRESLMKIFSPYFEITNPDKYVWNAWCSNSVEDIESGIVKDLPKADWLIGSIGRLDKSFVKNIIEGICEFADRYANNKIGLCFFGGANEKIIYNIKEVIREHKNISLYISGYIWPIPKNIFSNIDIFISGAGSANVSANMGVTTIRMDEINNEPLGYIDDPSLFHYIKKEGNKQKVVDYLQQALIEKNVPNIHNKTSIEDKWKIICEDFDKQMECIERSKQETKDYFQVNKIWDHRKIHVIKKLISSVTTYKQFDKINKIYSRLKGHDM